MRLFAVLAVGVFVHAQSMACCWNMTRPDQNVIIVPENSGMASDHSCCHKGSIPAKGSALSAPHMNCGLQAFDAAAIYSGSVTPDFSFPHIEKSLYLFEEAFSGFPVVSVNSRNGPPRFLKLRRLLI